MLPVQCATMHKRYPWLLFFVTYSVTDGTQIFAIVFVLQKTELCWRTEFSYT